MGTQNEATLSTHPARSETKKVTDKEPTRPVRNTRTWMKTTSYGKTKQHLFVGLLLGVIVLSTQAQALSIEQPGPPICCQAYNAKRLSCAEGISEEQFCRKNPRNFLGTPGCEKYTTPPDNNCCQAYNAKCESCKQGISEEECRKKNPSDFFGGVQGCEKYQNGGGSKPFPCCRANNAKCLSCAAGLSEEEYCKKNPSTGGCEKYRNRCQAYNAKCESCKQGISEEEFCKKNPPSDFFGGVQGCEKYHKGDGGNGCCKANTAECLACSEGKSVKRFCKKKRNRDVPGCEKYHRRGSWGKNDRDDSRQQGDGGFRNWFG